MGLDMYLNSTRFFCHTEQDKKDAIGKVLGIAPGEVKWVTVEAMYWRKANAIHAWFVENVQGGVDECQEHDVTDGNLKDLRDTVRRVLEDRSKAPELLPCQSGFFFGGTDYDEYYFNDLIETEKRLTELLEKDWKEWSFSYRSSW